MRGLQMNLLITGAFSCSDNELSNIKQLGHSIHFHKMESDPLSIPYEWVEGVICNSLFLHHPIINFKNLKYIQLTSAGFDRVDIDYIRQNGITIHNAKNVYSIPMSEFAVCGVLDLYKRSRFFANNQKSHLWDKHRSLVELYGKTVCIVGSGNVGTECAKRFKSFGTTVFAVDICKPQSDVYDKYFPLSEITRALPLADIIILSLPFTPQTKYLFDENMFSLFKSTAILVNIARGAIVKQSALCEALKNDRFLGAVLDVFENEPLEADSPLWDAENTIITPHNSFVGENNHQRLKDVIIKNLNEVI
jgi:phosphoglycerate dehydrogenase-like enzyme